MKTHLQPQLQACTRVSVISVQWPHLEELKLNRDDFAPIYRPVYEHAFYVGAGTLAFVKCDRAGSTLRMPDFVAPSIVHKLPVIVHKMNCSTVYAP